jgi:hypothetical protein
MMTAVAPFMGRNPTPDCVEQVIVIAGVTPATNPEPGTAGGSTTDGFRVRTKCRPE